MSTSRVQHFKWFGDFENGVKNLPLFLMLPLSLSLSYGRRAYIKYVLQLMVMNVIVAVFCFRKQTKNLIKWKFIQTTYSHKLRIVDLIIMYCTLQKFYRNQFIIMIQLAQRLFYLSFCFVGLFFSLQQNKSQKEQRWWWQFSSKVCVENFQFPRKKQIAIIDLRLLKYHDRCSIWLLFVFAFVNRNAAISNVNHDE